MSHNDLLIRRAEIRPDVIRDIRCRDGLVAGIGESLTPSPSDHIVDASRCALLRSLHDHHLHLMSMAAQLTSVKCGPPEVTDLESLEKAIRGVPGNGWIRGVGYHESVAGDLESSTLDEICPDRPIRVQHRSGRLWILNSRAQEELGLVGNASGQLYRKDEQVRKVLAPPESLADDVQLVCDRLLAMGITGVTDATPSNDESAREFIGGMVRGRVNVTLMGNEDLVVGPLKLLIDDYQLPDLAQFEERISKAHERGRPVAIHCVSRVELVFALSALGAVGSIAGDRIEHASVVEIDTLEMMRELGVTVVTQPIFIHERGDQYLKDHGRHERDSLYRIGGLKREGIAVGAGSDSPFGGIDPWHSMQSAVDRKTLEGQVIGESEGIEPEEALALYSTPPAAPGGVPVKIEEGEPADMCLLSKPWKQVRNSLSSVQVRKTIMKGQIVHESKLTAS